MLRKPLLIFGLTGILVIIFGIFFNLSLIESIAHHGKAISTAASIGICLIQLFLIVLGGAIVIESVIFSFLSTKNRTAYYLLGISVIGIAILIVGIISAPSFFQNKLIHAHQLNIEIINSLYNLQLLIITTGFLIFLIFYLIYINKFSSAKKKFNLISIPLVLILYFVLLYSNYYSKRYPNNILLKPGSYAKIYNLLMAKDILLSDYAPRTTLKVKNRHVLRAKYPVIDMHFHFLSDFITEEDRRVLQPDSLVKTMDSLNIKMIVGNDGNNIEELLKKYHDRYPKRFLNFTTLMTHSWPYPDDFLASRPEKLEELVKKGLSGVGEFPKELGIKIKDTSGKLINADDPRLDPLWDKAGELGVPIIWHVADPAAFFQPVNRYNERFKELSIHPEWSYADPSFPTRESLFKHRENVLKKHPNTTFILAHLGWCTNDLSYLGYLFDTYPNIYASFGATLSLIGRQPNTTRKFFIKYQDRIVFATDGGVLFGVDGWTIEKFYQAHFDFLETDDDYIKYPLQGAINQGDWKIYGINLPDIVLQKIYYKNAEKILFSSKKN